MNYQEFCPRRQFRLTAFFVFALAAAITLPTCTTECESKDLVFSEQAGGNVAYILERVNGEAGGSAVTLPDLDGCGSVRVYFKNGAEPCVRVHEETHTMQILAQQMRMMLDPKEPDWLWLYIQAHFKHGYKNNPYETEARAVQAACEAVR